MKPRYLPLYTRRFIRRYFFVILCISVFAMFVYFGTGSMELKCVRLRFKQVTCQFKNTNLYGLAQGYSETFNLSNTRTKTEVYDCGYLDNHRRCYRYHVWLESNMGNFSVPDLRSFHSIDEAENKAAEIRRYIHGSGSPILQFVYNQNPSNAIWNTIIVGASLLLVGWITNRSPN